jgi:hypothetical protein
MIFVKSIAVGLVVLFLAILVLICGVVTYVAMRTHSYPWGGYFGFDFKASPWWIAVAVTFILAFMAGFFWEYRRASLLR